ncbi:MAG: hypothetical protein M1827_005963 [Pycnora praestabilis]|nr:MAG: hypothetical protein M1827_005963 [Pycnora praestabilis]
MPSLQLHSPQFLVSSKIIGKLHGNLNKQPIVQAYRLYSRDGPPTLSFWGNTISPTSQEGARSDSDERAKIQPSNNTGRALKYSKNHMRFRSWKKGVTTGLDGQDEVARPRASDQAVNLPRNDGSFKSLRGITTQDGASRSSRNTPGSKNTRNIPNVEQASVATEPTTLLEELFPEEVGKGDKKTAQSSEGREIPRLILSSKPEDIDDPRGALERAKRLRSQKYRPQPRARIGGAGRQDATVLVLRNASKSLIEEDFRRIRPKGKHIEDWSVGDIIKGDWIPLPLRSTTNTEFIPVIPGRHPQTLEPLGHYFLLFSHPSSARVYQDHVSRLHKISRAYTPTSISSPLSPPPGYMADGEDIHELMQAYALIPPSQNLVLKIMHSPFTPSMKRIIEESGFDERLTGRDTGVREKRAVLFSVDGWRRTTSHIREAIEQDSRDRGLRWELSEGPHGNEAITTVASENCTSEEETEGKQEIGGDAEQGQKWVSRRGFTRWIVSFKDEMEARRFVRRWHRRPLPFPRGSAMSGEPPLFVNAEILW